MTAAPLGAAGATDYPTFFVKFKLSSGRFTGQIDSIKGKCVKDRRVVLVRKKGGDKKKLGSDGTNDRGKFRIGVGSPKRGKYFAEAKPQEAGKGTCAGARSAKVELD